MSGRQVTRAEVEALEERVAAMERAWRGVYAHALDGTPLERVQERPKTVHDSDGTWPNPFKQRWADGTKTSTHRVRGVR